jgi:hypothetical protein
MLPELIDEVVEESATKLKQEQEVEETNLIKQIN